MALFGYPVAQENDAERAVRAALSIQQALAELNRKNVGKPSLSARIGIELGLVAVDSGQAKSSATRPMSRRGCKRSPNRARFWSRRLCSAKPPACSSSRSAATMNSKVCPSQSRCFGSYARRRRPPLRAAASHAPDRSRRRNNHADAALGTGTARRRATRSDYGKPGLGKSRLLAEFHARLREMPHTWVEWSCLQLLQNTPLHPIGEWGRQRFGGAEVPAGGRLADLESSLTQVKLDPAENVALLAPLLDIPLPQERAPTLAPEELRRRQLAALTNWVMAGARVQPIVLAFEDLHWADPTTLDVLRGIAERGALAPLFVVATPARVPVRPCVRPVCAVHMTAGHNALRGSGPDQLHAFDNAWGQVGCPDRRIDRLCITCCSSSQPSHHARFPARSRLRRERNRFLVALAFGHHRPGHSGDLIGQGDGRDLCRPPRQQCREPGSMLGAMDLGVADNGERAGHEQAAQIAVTLFADTAEPVPAPARVLLRYDPDPGREIAPRWRQVGHFRCSIGRCGMSVRTSASVLRS